MGFFYTRPIHFASDSLMIVHPQRTRYSCVQRLKQTITGGRKALSHWFCRASGRELTAMLGILLLLVPAIPAQAKTRKGEKLRAEARVEEQKGNYDQALQLAEKAMDEDATDPSYRLEVTRVRFEAAAMHLKNGQKLRNDGKIEEALAEFQKSYGIDPSSDIAAQEIERTKEMIERNKRPGAKAEEKTLTPSALAHKEQQERTDSLLAVPELMPLNPNAIDLKMNNSRPRIMFETVAKIAGINVIFDPEYDQQQTIRTQSIDLTRTTLDQALDQLAVLTKSFWKPLSNNTIFVTVDNPTKRREYAEQVVKVFYLSNVTTPQEMQEILTVLRTVVDVQKVFSYTAQNALIVRAEADTMALVEKLIADLDKPRPEVIVDFLVMQVSSTHVRNITAAFASAGINTSAVFAPRPGITTPGIQSTTTGSTTTTTTGTTSTTTTPVTTTGTGTTGGSSSITSIPLNALSRISSADFSLTTLPGAALEAVLNDSSTRVLQSPQIRAVDNQKANLKIGEKVPTATGSFQPGVAGVGVSPLVNTQFTFLDVGVIVEILPRVHENGEVSLHVDIDVSQVLDRINLGGVEEPEIGQNKATADIRLKDGEVNLLGGIIQQTDTRSTSGIPGLANIPILGRLFSGENTERDRTELVIAMIPHIVRGPDIKESNLKGVAAGNATQIKVGFAPRVAAGAAPAVGPVATTPTSPANGGNPATIVTPPAGGPPATAPPATAPPATAPPIAPPATAPVIGAAPPGPPQAGGPARVTFVPATMDTQLGSSVTVTLYGDNVTDLISAAAQLRFDPKILRINNIVAGDLPQRNTGPMEPSKNILNDSGTADMSISRGPNDGGISGAGGLFTVVFQAVGRGNTTVSVSSLGLTASTGQAVNATAPQPLVINVR
jgi:general secretion pathway protein D